MVGLDRLYANTATSLKELGFNVVDAQRAVAMAQAIKLAEEVNCIVASLRLRARDGDHRWVCQSGTVLNSYPG